VKIPIALSGSALVDMVKERGNGVLWNAGAASNLNSAIGANWNGVDVMDVVDDVDTTSQVNLLSVHIVHKVHAVHHLEKRLQS
jgi:hypothetical protein